MNPIHRKDAGARMNGWYEAGKAVISQAMGRMLRPGYWTAKPTAGVGFVGALLRDDDGLWACQPDGVGGYRWEQGVNVGGDTMTGALALRGITIPLTLEAYSDGAFGAILAIDKSRHATPGSHAIVQSGDILGNLAFRGSNGTTFQNAARIRGEVDGTPGAGSDMPGRLVFLTTADGSSTLSERLRISSTGLVSIPSGGTLSVGGGTALTAILRGATTWDPGSVSAATPVSTTVTVTGAAVGDPVAVGLSTLTTQDLQLTGTVSAANTVTVVLSHADTVGSVDLGSGTLSAVVFQF